MKGQFFSVHINCSINGSKFRHGICYEMSDRLAPIIAKMAEEGTATIHEQEVRIISGVVYPCNKYTTQERKNVVPFTKTPSVNTQRSVPAFFPVDGSPFGEEENG